MRFALLTRRSELVYVPSFSPRSQPAAPGREVAGRRGMKSVLHDEKLDAAQRLFQNRCSSETIRPGWWR